MISRRQVLAGTGALVLGFASGARAQTPLTQNPHTQNPHTLRGKPPVAPDLPGALQDAPFLDSWIRIGADGHCTIFTGKAELGQGIATALLQIAAEELAMPVAALDLVTADTDRTPDEGYTAGSHSLQDSGTAIRHASAQIRELLLGEAASRLGVPALQLTARDGSVTAADGRALRYGELVSDTLIHVEAQPDSRLTDPARFTVMARPVQRIDIPAKVTGGAAYLQDLRPDGMVHGRVVRPPSYGAVLTGLDAAAVERMPGVLRVVRDGHFLGVIADKEWRAIRAMRALADAASWEEHPGLPDPAALPAALQALPAQDAVVHAAAAPAAPAVKTLRARFTRPYQAHGSIGPSCAIGQSVDGVTTVWTHTQGVFPDRAAIAEMLGVPTERVRCIQVQGSGCYGHNGADDAAADAALLAGALPGRPVRVQWMREQEHAWEPFGPAMVTEISAGLDADGRIAAWSYELWSNPHGTRPGGAGALLAARHLATPFVPQPQQVTVTPEGSGDRNSVPLYALPNARVVNHFLADMPVRVSAMRALGAYMNIFSIESFMDELAAAAGADPVAFRLAHLADPRGRDVITAAARRFGWQPGGRAPRDRGYGFAFARYKNLAAYCAIAAEIAVDRETGRPRMLRAVAAVDAGQVVNPDGLRNQVEGAIMQAMSWTLYESVSFDRTRITSVDWASYPILRFDAVPDSIEVEIIERPGLPFLGAGECGQGPGAAAVANAIAHATGHRFRDLPLTRERIRQRQ